MMSPAPEHNRSFWSSSFGEAALDFAQADYRWRTLGADREQWFDPEKKRELAAAFLRRHAAKLALEAPHLPG